MSGEPSSQLVIPMAGSGSRFVDAGYSTPKPLLPVHGVHMYEIVLANVLHHSITNIVIVARAEWHLTPSIDLLKATAGLPINIVEVQATTGGPAETVELAMQHLVDGVPVVVANSDQYVDASLHDFYGLCQSDSADGVILTMEDSDPKWSYVAADPDGWATEVREKKVISQFATVGIYGFSSPEVMSQAFQAMRAAGDRTNNEWYVAPSYNYLIKDAKRIRIRNLGPIGEVMHGLGIPVDYESFLEKPVSHVAAAKARQLFGHE